MTSNTPDLLEKIRAKVFSANPDAGVPNCRNGEQNHYCPNCDNTLPREITIADVLLATENARQFDSTWENIRSSYEKLLLPTYNQGTYQNDRLWNLHKDSLEDQSPECIAFISSILGVV